jgi:hypothetical protein
VIPVSPLRLGISQDFMKRRAPELAMDVAAELDTPEALARSYGLSPEQWGVLRDAPVFKALVSDAHAQLSGPAGVAERVRRKAAMMIDRVGLLDMGTIMGDPKASASTKIDAFNSIKDLAGLSKQQPATSAPGTSGPMIIINVPGPGGEPPKPFIVGELAEGVA